MEDSEEPMLVEDAEVSGGKKPEMKLTPKKAKNTNLSQRISVFDNNQAPQHLPVKVGSPVVSKTKLRRLQRQSYSLSPKAKSSSNESESDAPPPPPPPPPPPMERSSSDHVTYEAPLDGESKHALTPTKTLRKSSVRRHLDMFERINKETTDLSSHSAQSATRRRPRRISSLERISADVDSLISPRFSARKKAPVGGKSNQQTHYLSPGSKAKRSISMEGLTPRISDIGDPLEDDDDEFASSSALDEILQKLPRSPKSRKKKQGGNELKASGHSEHSQIPNSLPGTPTTKRKSMKKKKEGSSHASENKKSELTPTTKRKSIKKKSQSFSEDVDSQRNELKSSTHSLRSLKADSVHGTPTMPRKTLRKKKEVPAEEIDGTPTTQRKSFKGKQETTSEEMKVEKNELKSSSHHRRSYKELEDTDSPAARNKKRWRAKVRRKDELEVASLHSPRARLALADTEGQNATKRSLSVERKVELETSLKLLVEPAESSEEVGANSPLDSSKRLHKDGEPTNSAEEAGLQNSVSKSSSHEKEKKVKYPGSPSVKKGKKKKDATSGSNDGSPSSNRRSWRPKSERLSDGDTGSSELKDKESPKRNGRKSGKLKDRINMFNNAATEDKPAFLSSKYLKKLVKKKKKDETGEGESSNAEIELKLSTSLEETDTTDDGPVKEQEGEVKKKKKKKKIKISIDKKKAEEKDKKKKSKNRTKSFTLREKLKSKKSALVGQKDKDKNAVFVSALAQNIDDFSSLKMKEFAKDVADEKIIVTALRKNFVFEEMEEPDMEKLVLAMEQIKVDKGEEIIKQGDSGDFFYVIGRGDVSFYVDGKKVGCAGPGNSFGELALLYACPRAATVKIDTQPTSLFRVDQRTFRFMMQSQTKKSAEEKRKLLQDVPFLSGLGEKDVDRLCSVMKPVLFSTGDYIVEKGEEGCSFFILREGKVRVTDIFVGGTSYEDLFLGVGDHFGEDALISDKPRAANVVALTVGSAFSIDRESVQKVLGDFGSLVSKAQDRQKLESMKVLRDADLTSSDFDDLTKLIKDKSYSQDTIIFNEKDSISPSLYIVRAGAVKTISADGTYNEVIGVGGAFGQDQILAGSEGGATSVTAMYTAEVVSDCVCGVLGLEDCRTVIDTEALGDRIFSGGNAELEGKRLAMRKLMKAKVKFDDLDKDHIIGEGQFGIVWLVRADPNETKDKSQMLEFAMKCQFKEDPVRKDGAIEAIKREMTVIQQLNHPFIIDLVDTYETEDQLMMLTEAVKGGELWSRIHQEDEDGNWTSGMLESDARFYALVIADTIAYMHRQKFVFRDLKPENVLIDAEGYPTLCDFGFAKYCPDKTHTFCGTPNYLAPEIVLNRGHSTAVDHWALGIVVYEMITGENPFYFEGQDQMALLQAIVQEAYYPLPKTASPEVVDFMDKLMEKDPIQRLGSLSDGEKGILKHKWFETLDINDVRNKRAKAPYIPALS